MTPAKSKSKPVKEENPLVLDAEVCRTGRRRVLGKIVKVTKTLLTVKWVTGSTELFGRSGQAFYGRAGSDGEAVKYSPGGKPLEDLWSSEDDARITIATEGTKFRIAQGLANEAKAAEERAQKQATIESSPAYKKRQADICFREGARPTAASMGALVGIHLPGLRVLRQSGAGRRTLNLPEPRFWIASGKPTIHPEPFHNAVYGKNLSALD
jgi:hypothetical protein